MGETVAELARVVLDELEREDFIYAVKHYVNYKIITRFQDLKEWWDNV